MKAEIQTQFGKLEMEGCEKAIHEMAINLFEAGSSYYDKGNYGDGRVAYRYSNEILKQFEKGE